MRPISFTELQEALTAARGRLEELSRAAEAVAASGQLQQELAALQEENQKLRAEIEAVRTERGSWQRGSRRPRRARPELTKTVEQATAKAREMDQELVAVRWQNAQLNTSLAQARTSGEQMEAEARTTQNALKNRIGQLEGAAEQTSGETARLRKQIEASEQRIGVAERARTEAEARLGEMRDTVERAEQDKARIGADLAKVQESWRAPSSRPSGSMRRSASGSQPWRTSATSCAPAWRT